MKRLTCILLSFFAITTFAQSTQLKTTVVDFEQVMIVKNSLKKGELTYQQAYSSLIKAANNALKEELTSVVQKTQTPPSGSKHDYLSLAPYFWPDPNKADGLPWIRKDGQVNPLTRDKNVDEPAKDVMIENTRDLALANFFSDDQKYAKRAVEVLQTWFLNEETKMNPNLNYGQGIPGVNTGRCFGIIEFTGILEVITAIELLKLNNSIDEKTENGMKNWLAEYQNWLQTSEIGLQEKATKNNHGTWYDVQTLAILTYLKKDAEAKVVLENFKKRIAEQIDAEGKQKHELERTKSLSYSIMNLRAMTQMAYFGKIHGIDLWSFTTSNGGSIQKAYSFLEPFANGTKNWEYQQLGSLEDELEKLKHLFLFAQNRMNIKGYTAFSSKIKSTNSRDFLIYPSL
jgi:Alginate lyase